jgi:capsular polysaccharide export protein
MIRETMATFCLNLSQHSLYALLRIMSRPVSMTIATAKKPVFLFLQGPHGPFFHRLGRMLQKAGADVWRVGFNAGDRAFWFQPSTYIPFRGALDAWTDTFDALVEERAITDIVLYGDTRPVHAQAIARANALGLRIHVFEEGYMRPFWVSYERGGSNGNSRLMHTTVAQMQTALERSDMEAPMPPSHWGDMRQHVFYGALYHWFVMFRNGDYRNFKTHRDLPVIKEFQLYVKRLLLMPLQGIERRIATWRIRNGGFPYHLALLHLSMTARFKCTRLLTL